MNDLDTDLREMFQRREADVRGPSSAPQGIVSRARRRQARTILVGAVAAVTVLAASVGLIRSLPASSSKPAAPSPSVSAPRRYQIASATGEGLGGTWHFSAYHNGAGRLCSVFESTDHVSHTACGQLPGVLWLGDLERPAVAGVGRGAAIFGPITGRAVRVRLQIDGGGSVPGRIIPTRETFQFFVLIAHGHGSGELLGIDEAGTMVTSRRVSW